MTAFEEVLFAYIAAWSETDEQQRRDHLARSWAENALYIDPTGEVSGREALVQHIGKFLQRFPNHRFLLSSGVTQQRGWFRFNWVLVKPDGEIRMDGIDFGKVGSDGYLSSITGFFGSPPPVPSSWPGEMIYQHPVLGQE